MRRILFFIGPHGCGKGTQARKLASLKNIRHCEMSAFLTERGRVEDEIGEYIRMTMSSGGLVSNTIVIEVLTNAMEAGNWHEAIIDGFPRMLGQAQSATELLDQGYDVQFVVFDLDDATCLARMKGRVEKLSLEQARRREEGLPPLTERTDEDPQKQVARLKAYRENYPEIIGHLESAARGRVHYINARYSEEEIFIDLLEKLEVFAH